jgi:drug/metabolite transporter (DMT)-like permease
MAETMKSQRTGYLFALVTFTIFATQDGISKHLSDHYPPILITMIRYWAFATFATVVAARSRPGLRAVVNSRRVLLQIVRGLLLSAQIAVALYGFKTIGFIHSQAIFASTPLVVAVLSVPILGEVVGWRRWTAIAAGLCGVLIILKPDPAGFNMLLLIPVLTSVMMAFYSVITRLVGRDDDPLTSFFYTGTVGALFMTVIGPFYWTEIAAGDWLWLAAICTTGIVSHFCLIKAYEHLDAVLVQPFAYFQLVLTSFMGVIVFGETLHWNIVLGSAIVVAAGLFTIWREAVAHRRRKPRETGR